MSDIRCELCGDAATDHVTAHAPGSDAGRLLCAAHRDEKLRKLADCGWQAIVISVQESP
jgi:hypothetical protein